MKRRIDHIRENVQKASRIAARDPDDILLVAATKTVSPDRIQQAIEYGITIVGENRVQEAEKKIQRVEAECKWHFIGHLQRNKARIAVRSFDMIQSLDSIRLASAIDRAAKNLGRIIDVLVQVNIGREASKFGIKPEEVSEFVHKISGLSNIKVKGLMTIPPYTDKPDDVRPYLKNMRKLFEKTKGLKIDGVEMKYLSMGMTHDYTIAIEEGSNMIRVGSGIFGERA